MLPAGSIIVTMGILCALAHPYSIIVPIEIVFAPKRLASIIPQVLTSYSSLTTIPFSSQMALTKLLSSRVNSLASLVLPRWGETPVILYFLSSTIASSLQLLRSE